MESLRIGSYNKAVFRAAGDFIPEDVNPEIDINRIPLFNQDIDKDMPKNIKDLKI